MRDVQRTDERRKWRARQGIRSAQRIAQRGRLGEKRRFSEEASDIRKNAVAWGSGKAQLRRSVCRDRRLEAERDESRRWSEGGQRAPHRRRGR